MSEQERAVILRLTPEVLAESLQLPAEACVDAAWVPADEPGILLLRVRGVGWPTVPGEKIRIAQATCTVEYDDDDDGGLRTVIDWGFPS